MCVLHPRQSSISHANPGNHEKSVVGPQVAVTPVAFAKQRTSWTIPNGLTNVWRCAPLRWTACASSVIARAHALHTSLRLDFGGAALRTVDFLRVFFGDAPVK